MRPLPNTIYIAERENKTRYWTEAGMYYREVHRFLVLLKVIKT